MNTIISLDENYENKNEEIDFKNINFILIVGQTGTGKSIFHNFLYK